MTRLQELVKQATHDVLGVKQVDSIILAELIAQDCVNIAMKEWEEHGYYEAGGKRIATAIKQHFNLE